MISREKRNKLRTRAYYAVRQAVKNGGLPPVATLLCADCGCNATQYDHRDYHNALCVEPTCKQCNIDRGMAAPYVLAARKKKTDSRQSNIRFSTADRKLVEKAAKINGLPFSTYIRHVTVKAAKRAVK